MNYKDLLYVKGYALAMEFCSRQCKILWMFFQNIINFINNRF